MAGEGGEERRGEDDAALPRARSEILTCGQGLHGLGPGASLQNPFSDAPEVQFHDS